MKQSVREVPLLIYYHFLSQSHSPDQYQQEAARSISYTSQDQQASRSPGAAFRLPRGWTRHQTIGICKTATNLIRRCLTSRLPRGCVVLVPEQNRNFSGWLLLTVLSDRWLVVSSSAMLDAHQPTNPPKMSSQGRHGQIGPPSSNENYMSLSQTHVTSSDTVLSIDTILIKLRCVCDGWSIESLPNPLQVTGSWSIFALRHMPAVPPVMCKVMHELILNLLFLIAWAPSCDVPTLACPCCLMWCVPWPNWDPEFPVMSKRKSPRRRRVSELQIECNIVRASKRQQQWPEGSTVFYNSHRLCFLETDGGSL
jgi:hypothetical protein